MKWKAKYTEVEPADGTTRLKRTFAWQPEYVDGEMVWLSYYEILQGWVIKPYVVIIDGSKKEFKIGSWINLSKRICPT